MRAAILATLAVALLACGCSGGVAAQVDTTTGLAPARPGLPVSVEERLLAVWRAALTPCHGGAGCRTGAYETGAALIADLRRTHPAIPISVEGTGGAATHLPPEGVVVLADSTGQRLDIAAAAGRKWWRLVVVGAGQPRFMRLIGEP